MGRLGIQKYYDSAMVEEKKYLLKIIIREIKLKLKKNKDSREIGSATEMRTRKNIMSDFLSTLKKLERGKI